MGGCGSSNKNEVGAKPVSSEELPKYLGKGEAPKQIVKAKNPNVKVYDIVYLFGGSKILQFDTKAKKISNLPVQPSVIPPKRTQCEYIASLDKIVTLGGTQDGKISKLAYLWDPKDWSKTTKLPDFPVPIRFTTLAYVDGLIYTIGGETEGSYPENMLKDVYALRLTPEVGTAWEKITDLPTRRRSTNVMVAGSTIYIFGGMAEGGPNGTRTTSIDLVDTKTKKSSADQVRLPLGVEGARMCWVGDDILLIGGKRDGDKPDSNVLLLDFEKKAIMSLRQSWTNSRDLLTPRAYPVVIPISIDEVVVIGGAKTKQAEHRKWNAKIGDYEFAETTIEGQDLLEGVDCYDSALPTFQDVVSETEVFPEISKDSRIIFGNEIDCFLIEITKDRTANFYKSPMKLQQKSGQSCLKLDSNTIFLAGGTDFTRTKFSAKTYRFLIGSKEVTELARLNSARYFPVFVNDGNKLFVIGGKVAGGQSSEAIEMLDLNTHPSTSTSDKWQQLPPMKHKRFGHFAWTADHKIFVMGGTSVDKGKPIEDIEIFDIATKTWSVHPSKLT